MNTFSVPNVLVYERFRIVGELLKVTTLKDFWVLEWTDNRSYAENGCFEDVDLMPYDISEQEILEYIDGVLRR